MQTQAVTTIRKNAAQYNGDWIVKACRDLMSIDEGCCPGYNLRARE
jgi:hypothetical protein